MSHVRRTRQTGLRDLVGSALAVLGAALIVFAAASPGGAAASTTQTVPLHNDDAQVESDCPDDAGDYWHFVIAPNDDTYAFVSITLNLAGSSWTFDGADLLPNGGQLDNVFVAVPAGHDVGDLVAAGSSAAITPPGDVKFVLSHVCEGGSGLPTTTTSGPTTTADTNATTTTTDATTTTTTGPTTTDNRSTTTDATTTTTDAGATTTTTTTTTSDSTTTTDATTTTTGVGSGGPTTTAATSTTTGGPGSTSPATGATTTAPTVGQQGPTTTAPSGSAGGATTTLVGSGGATTAPTVASLAVSGSDWTGRLLVVGAILVLVGGLLQLGRQRSRLA